MKRIIVAVIVATLAILLVICMVFPAQTDAFLARINGAVDGIGKSNSVAVSKALQSETPPQTLKIHFIDVDQAKAILVCAPTGEFMLVDAGSDASEPQLLSYLDDINPEQLEIAVFTHPHEDHIGGADAVLREYTAKKILLPDVSVQTTPFEKMLEQMEMQAENGSEIIVPEIGDIFELGGVDVTILSPEIASEENLNNSSIVMRLEWEEASVLLTGDAEKDIELELVTSGVNLEADVLDAGHHGSDTSSTDEFLDAVDPEIMVISCGVDNSYGHPALSVIDRLNDRRIPFYRTDKQGTVVVSLDRNGKIDVEVSGK